MYDYFEQNYGKVKNPENNFQQYNNLSKSKLKKCLKDLKERQAQLEEIKYVSHLLRNKLRKNEEDFRDHEKEVNENLWKYCENTFEKNEKPQPQCTENSCYSYFKSLLTEKWKAKTFQIRSWLKLLQ